MNGYYIQVTNNLLEKKHYLKMKESVWLFMWFLDKITAIDEKGTGKVLGGKPIKHEDVEKELGLTLRTYRRWLLVLKNNKYIDTLRTPYGLVITVNKAKKTFGKRGDSLGKKKRDVPNMVKRCATSGISNKTINKDNIHIIYNDKKIGDKRGKPTFQGMPMRKDNFTGEWKILDNGTWCVFGGREKDIIWVKK